MDATRFSTFDALLDKLPPEATVSRMLLDRTIAAQRASGDYDARDLFPALISALVTLELDLKGLELRD